MSSLLSLDPFTPTSPSSASTPFTPNTLSHPISSTATCPIPLPLSMNTLTRLSLHKLPSHQYLTSVFISNISHNANIKHLSDFFAFCGTVQKIVMGEWRGDRDTASSNASSSSARHIFAVLIFESHSAYQTSLLLSNAVIIDKPIHIQSLRNTLPVNMQRSLPRMDYSSGIPADRSALSVAQSLISKGYYQTQNALDNLKDKARNLDQSTLRLNESWQSLREKVNDASLGDTMRGISEKSVESLRHTKSVLDNTWKQVDDKLRLTDKADTAKAGFFVAGVQAKEQLSRANTKVIGSLSNATVSSTAKLKDSTSQLRHKVNDLKMDEKLRNVNESMQSGLMSGWSYFKGALNTVVDQFKGEEEQQAQQQRRSRRSPQRSSQKRSSQMPVSSSSNEIPDALADSDDDGDEVMAGSVDFDNLPETQLFDDSDASQEDDDELSEDDLFARPSMSMSSTTTTPPPINTARNASSLLDLGADDSDGTPVSAVPLMPSRATLQQDMLSFDDSDLASGSGGAQENQLLEFD